MITLAELITPITPAQAMETFLSELEALSIPARSWRKGGAYRNILQAVAYSYAGFSTTVANLAASGFLDYASGDWLTLVARLVYGEDRAQATFATGKVLFTNTGGGVYTNAAGTVRVLWTAGGKSYVTTDALSLLTMGATQLVSVQAVEIGSASSVGPGGIDALETVLLGVTVTNPAAIAGSDAQSDDSLKQLCRDKLAALSMLGARGAYEYAIGVAKRLDGSPVDVNRWRIVPNSLTGVVSVTLASPTGPVIAGDIQAVKDSIELWARPDSVTANVYSATPLATAKSLTVWAKQTPGVDAATLQTLVSESLLAMVREYPIGGLNKPPSVAGYLFASNIAGAADAAHPSIFAVDGIGADIPMTAQDVITLTATITIRIVP